MLLLSHLLTLSGDDIIRIMFLGCMISHPVWLHKLVRIEFYKGRRLLLMMILLVKKPVVLL